MSTVLVEARWGLQIPWNWHYKQLRATQSRCWEGLKVLLTARPSLQPLNLYLTKQNSNSKNLLGLERCVCLFVLVGIILLVYSSSKWPICCLRAMRIPKLSPFPSGWMRTSPGNASAMPHATSDLNWALKISVKKLGTDTGFWRLGLVFLLRKCWQQMSPSALPGTQVHLG